MTQEALTVPCARCGAALPVDPSAPAARCGHCGATTPVPEAMRERARGYLGAVAAERRKASFAQRIGQGFADADALTRAGGRLFPMILALALLLTAGQMAPAFLDVGDEVRGYSVIAFVVGLGLALLGFFVSLARAVEKTAARAAQPEPEPVPVEPEGAVRNTCSACGGPVTFLVGQASARCGHCGATVVATAADQAAMVALAGRRADLEQARAQRAGYRARAGFGQAMGKTMSWMRWGLSLGMPCAMLIGMGVTFLNVAERAPRPRGRRGPPPPPPVFTYIGLGMLGAGVAILVIAVGVALLVAALSRPRAIGRALAALSAHVRGRVRSGDVTPALDWLDAHWAGPAPEEVMTMSASDDGDRGRRWTLDFAHGGHPAMVVVAHAPHVRRVDVFLAAYRRRGPEAQRAPQSAAGQEAQRAGFGAEVSQAGVHLWRTDSDPAALKPEGIDRLLACAAAMGA